MDETARFEIAVVIPVFNGAASIAEVVTRIGQVFRERSHEIVLVDDGSADDSARVCRALVDGAPLSIRFIQLSRNFGEHSAVLAGLARTDSKYIAVLDDDGQNPPEELPRMLAELDRRELDVIYGKYSERQHHWFRQLGSSFNDRVANIMLRKPPDLYLSSFKVMNRFIVREIIKYSGPFPYIDGLICRTSNRLGTNRCSACGTDRWALELFASAASTTVVEHVPRFLHRATKSCESAWPTNRCVQPHLVVSDYRRQTVGQSCGDGGGANCFGLHLLVFWRATDGSRHAWRIFGPRALVDQWSAAVHRAIFSRRRCLTMTNFYVGRKVLITGGLGFIGSNLAIELVARGARVTLLDSMIPSYGATIQNIEPIRDRVMVNYSDVRDLHSLPYVVRDQEVIFSLAGQVSHIESMQDPLVDLDINCRSQLSLLECCRRENPTARLVLASTRQIYGKPQTLPVTESHPLGPTDINGVNKLAAEMYFKLYAEVYGLSTISLRLTNTYGPRMDLQNRKKGFVGVFIQQALRGERIRLFGDGQQRRDFNFVGDVTRALAVAGESLQVCGESFNIGHHEHYSLFEFVELLAKHCPTEFEFVPFPRDLKAIDIGDYYADYSRFQELTGWSPQIDLDEGLELTLRHYRQLRQAA